MSGKKNLECDIIHEKKETKTIRDMQVSGKKCFLHFIHRKMNKLMKRAKEINDKSIKGFIKTYTMFEEYILN